MIRFEAEYYSIGANRNTAASAYSEELDLFAFGANSNVALWQPNAERSSGIGALLKGAEAKVTAVAFRRSNDQDLLISGDAAGRLCIWKRLDNVLSWSETFTTEAHIGAINVICANNNAETFVTAGADGVIKVWRTSHEAEHHVLTIKTKPRFIPLSLAIGEFPNVDPSEAFFLCAAGTRNDIQLYTIDLAQDTPVAHLQASLPGHEGWIRSLTLKRTESTGYLLASTSSDKYVRLWKFGKDTPSHATNGDLTNVIPEDSTLNAKAKVVAHKAEKLSVTFEALLLGHEDWVYSAEWETKGDRLLTASADGTLAIWEPDPTSGIWISETRLGEISGQKGATTATGSSGGFWKGIWINSGGTLAVVALGRTGSWRLWEYDDRVNFWQLRPGLTGHIASTNGLSWSNDGGYLLSTSSDQTTRLHAEWRTSSKRTWHEFSRPQIHGYDLNCVSCTGLHQFVSGADEKLLRVFDEPKDLAQALQRLCGIEPETAGETLPDTAAIPVLGLSNKAQGEPDDHLEAGPNRKYESDQMPTFVAEIAVGDLVEPPTEDLLSRHTLWPELEKLYGHGYEISQSAYCPDTKLLATSCKASSLDHAVIRLYDTTSKDWREVKPPLAAHSLTVTRLAWSAAPDNYLLSVGRDRQWSVFGLDVADPNKKNMKLLQSMPKAHTRMILDCAFSPISGHVFFATAGRDKSVKLWAKSGDAFELCNTLARENAVTAIDFTSDSDGNAILAVGEENGNVSIHFYNKSIENFRSVELDSQLCPTKAINKLAWRPAVKYVADDARHQLAIAVADGSVRILKVNTEIADGSAEA